MGSKRKRGAKEGANSLQNPQKRTKNESEPSTKKNKTKTPGATKTKADPTQVKALFVESPIGEDRKREADLYELLGSEDPEDRLKAGECVVHSLLGPEGGEGVSGAILRRHLDRRLFRGLASGRNASRVGFSLVLSDILGQLFGEKALAESTYEDLDFDTVLQILTEKIQIIGNIPGQEERDHYWGQYFGLCAFVKAGILFRDISRWNTVLDLLLKLAAKKVWLRSHCGWAIVEAIDQMNQKQAKATLERVAEANLAKTPEGVAIWLVALARFPDLKVKPWSDPLAKKSFGDLAAVLRESFQDFDKDQPERGQKNKQASWTAQSHFVWDILLAHYLKEGEAKAEEFQQFWARVVDDSLFAKSATDGQKFKGFQVFQKMLEGLVTLPLHLEALFSKNLSLCLMNQAAKEDRYLHRAATKALKTIESTVSANPSTLVPILKSLLGQNGAYNFDQRTNTKTIDRLLQNISEETGQEVINIIQKPISTLGQQETAQATSTLRVYVDYLSKTLNASTSATSGKIQQKVFSSALQELSQLAYSQPKHIPADALTEGVRELCRTRLESSFAKVSRRTEDYGTLCLAVSSIDPDSVAMSEEISEAVQNALSRMQKLLKRKTSDDNEKSLYQALAMLHAVSVFQLYNEDPDAMEVLNDLAQYSDRLKKGKSAEGEAGTSEFLVEILLSFVARPSSLMREVSKQVFDAFTPQISAGGLELLTGPLSSNESTKGQKELFSTGEDEMEVDEDEEDEEGTDGDEEDNSDIEIDSDVEFIDINEANDESGDDDEDDDEEEEDDDKNKGEFDKPEDLDNALEKILNSHRLDKDVEADSSEDEGDMSDSEMFAIDEQLAAAIKPRIQDRTNDSKKQKKEAKQSVVNFKHRILDLLEIYVNNEPLSPLAFPLLPPLLNLMRTTSTKALATRACDIILKYQKALKKARSNREKIEIADRDGLLGVLLEIHEAVGQDNAHAYAKACSAASLIVVSALFAADKDNIKDVIGVYAKTWESWVLRESKPQSSFFLDWYNWSQNTASQA
ncbi:DNA-directed DNA polymerase [Fusarium irregulare]|uniref:DNA-directed DNA polymerase n=1 Tax=Fusarium irregulare TaxID=2494466 RepID=A0A9W8PTY0_9HYPO|nr:DNA-directed DNA polymerase [Fusarium irregulare]KAJ4023335.1 DNA-directed DNA polymerase [Fusarium irregulare]